MLFINYKGDTPQQRFYSLGVKGNHNANIVRFIVARQQADIDLTDYVCNLKVQNKEHDYLDLIMLNGEYDEASDTISFEWLLPRKSTQYRNLELQLEFLASDEDIVWQTLIVELELNDTIKVGDEVDDKELSVIKEMEKEVADLQIEVDTIINNKVLKEVEIYYDENTDYTTFRFPRGVIPLMLKLRVSGYLYYFDYQNNCLLDENGDEVDYDEASILGREDTSQISIQINEDLRGDLYQKGTLLYYWLADYQNDDHTINLNGWKIIQGFDDLQRQLDLKVNKMTSPSSVYGTDYNGEPCMYDILNDIKHKGSVVRTKGGVSDKDQVLVPLVPTWTSSATSKEYVDNHHDNTKSNATNVENGVGTNSLQQKRDTTSVNFTGRNPNAEALDPTLSATFDTGASGEESITINGNTMAFSKRAFANGNKTIAKGEESHAEGYQSVSLGDGSHAEGSQTTSKGLQSHSEGALTQAIGDGSHAEGHSTIAGGHYSHAEGSSTKIGNYAQESGIGADQSSGGGGGGDTPDPDPSYVASAGEGSHAEGYNSVIKGYGSHAEGVKNYVDGNYSHAEGVNNTLTGKFAHAEGFNNINTGECSHIEGVWNTNSGYGAFVGGYNNTNTKPYKFVFGYYNENKNNTLLEVGNGNEGVRKNAFEVYEDGHAEVDLMGSTNKSVATKKYVDDNKSSKQVLGQATLSYDSVLNYYKMTLNIPKATLKQYDILVFTMANSYVYFGVSQNYDESHSVGSFLNTSTGNYVMTRVGLYMSANSCEVRFGTEYDGGSSYSSLGGAIVGIKL